MLAVAATTGPAEHSFSPYDDNGGTILAIAGSDFCLIAGDTRQSDGYAINSRSAPKTFPVTHRAVLATSGFHADGVQLAKRIKQQTAWFEHEHRYTMTTESMAQMLSGVLYGKRFFPYYVFSILGGVDAEGRGCVYSYDPVGSFERRPFQAGGSGASLIQPFLDNQLGGIGGGGKELPSLERAMALVDDAFSSATERDIHTGDAYVVYVVRADGVEARTVPLKRD